MGISYDYIFRLRRATSTGGAGVGSWGRKGDSTTTTTMDGREWGNNDDVQRNVDRVLETDVDPPTRRNQMQNNKNTLHNRRKKKRVIHYKTDNEEMNESLTTSGVISDVLATGDGWADTGVAGHR